MVLVSRRSGTAFAFFPLKVWVRSGYPYPTVTLWLRSYYYLYDENFDNFEVFEHWGGKRIGIHYSESNQTSVVG